MVVTNEAKRLSLWLACWLGLWLVPGMSAAQQSTSSDWQLPSLSCEPACREGYECRRGECTPACSPSCDAGFVCSAGGSCVRAEEPQPRAAKPRWSEPAPAPNECSPSCRTGYTCLSNRCVSLCNPVCAVGEHCTENGECVADGGVEPERAAEPERLLRDPSERALVNLHLDVAGALQLGVTPTLEIGQRVSGYVRVRPLNSGIASYFVLGRDGDDDLRWGIGAALGFHVFSAERGSMRGFMGGLALEYAYLETRDSIRDFATYRTHALVPQLDFGYRWGFGGLLVGVRAWVGLAIPFRNRASPFSDRGCARASSCVEDYGVAVIPGLAVDLGWFIPRGD